MRPEVAKAIESLVSKGATIIGPKPEKSPSLENYTDCDNMLVEIADKVWGDVDGETITMGQYGLGYVFSGQSLEEVLEKRNVEQDVRISSDSEIRCASAGSGNLGIRGEGGIVFSHRTGKDQDIYFLANTTGESLDFTASFRSIGKKPSFWNAVTSEISEDIAFSQEDGRTNIPIHLEASESIFVIFDGEIDSSALGSVVSNNPEYITLEELNDNWKVQFNGHGAPEEIVFSTLSDWSEHTNPTIRNYSGTAVYEKSFILNQQQSDRRIILDLGEASVIARVFVNGKDAGTVWTSPWEIDIGNLAIEGENDLKIHLTNTWYNRVLADSELSENKPTTYISQSYRFRTNSSMRGGLLGPVRIKQLK